MRYGPSTHKITQAISPEVILGFSTSLTLTKSYQFYLLNIFLICSILSTPTAIALVQTFVTVFLKH